MSWVRIWLHLVFSTKNRAHVLLNDIRPKIFRHIEENAENKNIRLDCVNGYSDHIHCLVSLGKEQSISEVAQLIKGESSHWINQNNLCAEHFQWQDDYWAVSVSESHLEAVREYIHNQDYHHRQQSFEEEVSIFMKKYGWTFLQH